MNWWDQGYWLAQNARRVAVSNPTQHGAPTAGRFYSETDEIRARDLLRAEQSRYVLADWELPFRRLGDGTIMGRFQSVVDWAGRPHAPYYEIYYRRDSGQMVPVWVFHEPYYRSMAFRLAVLGGTAGEPANSTWVIRFADRVDSAGMRFREVLTEHAYATFEAARQAASGATDALIVGLDPWQPAFPVDPVHSLKQLYAARTSEHPVTTPWVRVFEVR
jgi:asparagine N-glycosylation enzyme membrane subunit Stt3